MATGEFNTVKINTTYLTMDGTALGLPCRVAVEGLVALRPAFGRLVKRTADGTPRVQYRERKGRSITITIFTISETALDTLLAELDSVEAASSLHNLVISGDTGDFNVDCVREETDAPGTFNNGHVHDVKLVFAVYTVNSIS